MTIIKSILKLNLRPAKLIKMRFTSEGIEEHERILKD